MAVVGGGGVLLRAPSTSAVEPRQRRRRAPSSIRCGSVHGAATMAGWPAGVGGGRLVAEEDQDHYRTLRLAPGATRDEVKKAFRCLALRYHPDVRTPGSVADGGGGGGGGMDFQRINAAYQVVMSGMRAADERLEYWRLRYGLADEDLDRYRRYLNDDDDDDWFDL